jgi:hypothetical protein
VGLHTADAEGVTFDWRSNSTIKLAYFFTDA